MKDTDHSFSPALMAYDAMQELLLVITDGHNTSPFPDGSVKAGAVEDALSTMLYIHQTLHPELLEQEEGALLDQVRIFDLIESMADWDTSKSESD